MKTPTCARKNWNRKGRPMKDIITDKVFHVQKIHFKDGNLLHDCLIRIYNGFLIIGVNGSNDPAAWYNADTVDVMEGVKIVTNAQRAMDFYT